MWGGIVCSDRVYYNARVSTVSARPLQPLAGAGGGAAEGPAAAEETAEESAAQVPYFRRSMRRAEKIYSLPVVPSNGRRRPWSPRPRREVELAKERAWRPRTAPGRTAGSSLDSVTGWQYRPAPHAPSLFRTGTMARGEGVEGTGKGKRQGQGQEQGQEQGRRRGQGRGWDSSPHTESQTQRDQRTNALVKGSYRDKVSSASQKYGAPGGARPGGGSGSKRRSAAPRRPSWDVEHNKIAPPPRRLDENWELSPGPEPVRERMLHSQMQYDQSLGSAKNRRRLQSATAKVMALRRVVRTMSPILVVAQDSLAGLPEPGDAPPKEDVSADVAALGEHEAQALEEEDF